jgi:hypothetical protein
VALVGVVIGLVLVGVLLWGAVAGVLALSDLCFAGARLMWWKGSAAYREGKWLGDGSLLRWSAVKWFWRQGVSEWARDFVVRSRARLWWVAYPRERARVGVGWCVAGVVCGVVGFGVACLINFASGPKVTGGGGGGRRVWPGWEAVPEWGWWCVMGVVLCGLLGVGLWIRQGWLPRTEALLAAERADREETAAAGRARRAVRGRKQREAEAVTRAVAIGTARTAGAVTEVLPAVVSEPRTAWVEVQDVSSSSSSSSPLRLGPKRHKQA